MSYTLNRVEQSDEGTFGRLIDGNGKVLCCTAELPWNDNEPDKSCIPLGYYQVISYTSPKHGSVWQILNVPNRSNIEIHSANWPSELLGCVAVGDEVTIIEGKKGVSNSVNTLNMLKNTLPDIFALAIISSTT